MADRSGKDGDNPNKSMYDSCPVCRKKIIKYKRKKDWCTLQPQTLQMFQKKGIDCEGYDKVHRKCLLSGSSKSDPSESQSLSPQLDLNEKTNEQLLKLSDVPADSSKLCEYCEYQGRPSTLLQSTEHNVKDFSQAFKEYVTTDMSSSREQCKKGLLKNNSIICSLCFDVLEKKFDDHQRKLTLTPQKKRPMSRKRLIFPVSDDENSELKIPEVKQDELFFPIQPPSIESDQNLAFNNQNILPEIEIQDSKTEHQSTSMVQELTKTNLCPKCDTECSFRNPNRKKKKFQDLNSQTMEIMKKLDYSFNETNSKLIHTSCHQEVYNTIRKGKNDIDDDDDDEDICEPISDEPLSIIFDDVNQSIGKFIEEQISMMISDKTPIYFSHLNQSCLRHIERNHSGIDANEPNMKRKILNTCLYVMNKQVKSIPEIQILKPEKPAPGESSLYYHKDTNFKKLYFEMVKSINNSTSEASSTTSTESLADVLPDRNRYFNQKKDMHCALQILIADLKYASKICDIYARYPELISNVTMQHLTEGRSVKVSDSGSIITIPGFPKNIWNFLSILSSRKGSEINQQWNEGHFDWENMYLAHEESSGYNPTAVIGLLSTILHLHNSNNVYPFPMKLAEIFNTGSNSDKLQVLYEIGVLPYHIGVFDRYQETVARLQQIQIKDGKPPGHVVGVPLVVHADNLDEKHGNVQYQQLALSEIQANPSNFLSNKEHSCNEQNITTVTGFDIIHYTERFPELDTSLLNSQSIESVPSNLSLNLQHREDIEIVTPRLNRPKEKIELDKKRSVEKQIVTAKSQQCPHNYVLSDFLITEGSKDELKYNNLEAKYFVNAKERQSTSRYLEETHQWTQLVPHLKEKLRLEYTEVEKTIVVYLALIPGVPNSEENLITALEIIDDIFCKKNGHEHVIISADAVELDALYKVRDKYFHKYGHFYFLPGFWHTLLNYLIQYYSEYMNAGLYLLLKGLLKSDAKIKYVSRVKSNWGEANSVIHKVGEALMRTQWESFENFVKISCENPTENDGYESLMDFAKVAGDLAEFQNMINLSTLNIPKLVSSKRIQNKLKGKRTQKRKILSESTFEFHQMRSKRIRIASDSKEHVAESDDASCSTFEKSSGLQTTEEEHEFSTIAATSTDNDISLHSDENCEAEISSVNNEGMSLAEFAIHEEKLYEFFQSNLQPSFRKFVEHGEKNDEMFGLFSVMLKDLYPYIFGIVSMRYQDFEGQQMVNKLLHELVYVSRQKLYKQVLRRFLAEFPTWEKSYQNALEIAPGGNEIDGGVGVTLAKDEFHERTCSRDMKQTLSQIITEKGIEVACHSATKLSMNRKNTKEEFFNFKSRRNTFITNDKLNKDEEDVQNMMSKLKELKAFDILNRKLKQPGTDVEVDQLTRNDILQKRSTAKSLAENIVKSQYLKQATCHQKLKEKRLRRMNPYDSSTSKKRKKVNPTQLKLDTLQVLLTQVTKEADNTEREMSQFTTNSHLKYPPLYFDQGASCGHPLITTTKSQYREAIIKTFGGDSYHSYASQQIGSRENTLVIMDAMPVLYTLPTGSDKSFDDYFISCMELVFKQFHDTDHIILVFDQPNVHEFNLKSHTQQTRDKKVSKISEQLEKIEGETPLPLRSEWTSFLANRSNKANTIKFFAHKFLNSEVVKNALKDEQKLTVNGCFEDSLTYTIDASNISCDDTLKCKHEEADTALFAFAKHSNQPIVKLVAMDTDIFADILITADLLSNKRIYLEYERGNTINMTEMMKNIQESTMFNICEMRASNPDFSIPVYLGLFYLFGGNDILCSPRGMSHRSILKGAMQYGESFMKPHLIPRLLVGDRDECTDIVAKVVIMLFKHKYSNNIKKSVRELISESDVSSTLKLLRQEVWHKTTFANNHVPTLECIRFRTLNILYYIHLHRQCKLIQSPLDPTEYGWRVVENQMQLIEDSAENISERRRWFDNVMQKCSCKQSMCKTSRCSCKRSKKLCSRLCSCSYCDNTMIEEVTQMDEIISSSESDSDSSVNSRSEDEDCED